MLCCSDVVLLGAFVSSGKKKDKQGSFLREVDSVSGAEMEPEFADSFAYRFDVSYQLPFELAFGEVYVDSCFCVMVFYLVKPFVELLRFYDVHKHIVSHRIHHVNGGNSRNHQSGTPVQT